MGAEVVTRWRPALIGAKFGSVAVVVDVEVELQVVVVVVRAVGVSQVVA